MFGLDKFDAPNVTSMYDIRRIHGGMDNIHRIVNLADMNVEQFANVDVEPTIMCEEPTIQFEATMVDAMSGPTVIEDVAEIRKEMARRAFMDACRAASDEASMMGAALFGGIFGGLVITTMVVASWLY